jgi:DNA-binding NarL/FixJ family response regulator
LTLAAAVRAVADDKNLIDLSDEERDEVLETYREAELDPGAAALTAREREILQLLAVGVSATDELADRLYISQKTVKNHLASIFQKLAVSDRTQAAIEAIRLGIARPS